MNAKEAVAARILALCDERGIAINALASSSGVAPSTVYSMLNAKSQNPGVVSLQKLCDGLGISLREFFDDNLFACEYPHTCSQSREMQYFSIVFLKSQVV